MKSPPKPWEPGTQPTYTAFQMVVNICQDEFGNVWSDHDFLTPRDEEISTGLTQGGVPQVAHALLTEAVRREVFTSLLLLMSRDPAFLAHWMAADAVRKKGMEAQVAAAALHVITQTANKMISGATAGVLTMMSQGMPPVE